MADGTTHMMGVGGIGMSALAAILRSRGEAVSGCDIASSAITDKLAALGVAIQIGHDRSHLAGVSRLIISDAIRQDNPELVQARSEGVPVLRRSQALAQIMDQGPGIAVAGTHGKTTISAMVALILQQAGLDPTVLIGGELDAIGGNYRAGKGEWVLAEACEAYNSFLDLRPEIALVANIEADHLDFHGTLDRLRGAFEQFVQRIKPGGCLVWCSDRDELRALASGAACRTMSYALKEGADLRATDIRLLGFGSRFRIEGQGEVRLNVPGLHNVSNAAGAAACALQAGVPFHHVAAALEQFEGVKRRFQRIGEIGGITVVDDYAHHPTEIRATLSTARPLCQGRLFAVFQPHLYSRTRDLLDDFANSFDLADAAVITEIYPAREDPIPGVSGDLVAERARAQGKAREIEFIAEKKSIAPHLAPRLKPGDWVMILGAGDVDAVGRDLVGLLAERMTQEGP
jgi:UDP-N-acetylmuramate--alanine ligase